MSKGRHKHGLNYFALVFVFPACLCLAAAQSNYYGEAQIAAKYEGEPDLAAAFTAGQPQGRALAHADFDEDGMPDLVSGYALGGAGALALWRGNAEGVFPSGSAAIANSAFDESPFLLAASVWRAPVVVDWIGAGDFDADGHEDVVVAGHRGTALYFLSGDGRGYFRPWQVVKLPGVVTALAVGEMNRRDGLPEVVVGINGVGGAQVLVFESPAGAFAAVAERFPLPAPARNLALGSVDEGPEMDLVVSCGRELLLIAGRERKLSLENGQREKVTPARITKYLAPRRIKSLALGEFSRAQDGKIALLLASGALELLGRPPVAPSAVWESRLAGLQKRPGASGLVKVRSSGADIDELALLYFGPEEITLTGEDESGVFAALASQPLAHTPVAAAAMRLNQDALSDLVILDGTQPAARVFLTRPQVTFIVNTVADTDDGACNTANCTLREAINAANANAGVDTINFNIPGSGTRSILVGGSGLGGLPGVTGAVTINGASQPDYAGAPLIELNGSAAGNAQGLNLAAGNSVVRGLAINRFNGDGLVFANGGNNLVEGNYIGTDAAGNSDQGNAGIGLYVFNSFGNTIGGTTASARNIISGNGLDGVTLFPSSNNVLQGNYIGTNAAGTAALGNSRLGVFVTASNNTIGGTAAGARNVISGNSAFGIQVQGDGTFNCLIQGNYIGANATGLAALGNGGGIYIISENTHTVGGTTPSARNIIAGNLGDGVVIALSITGNQVQGNYIGLSANGAALGNSALGLWIFNADNNVIGGAAIGAGNVISANGRSGVAIYGGDSGFGAARNARNNLIQGNFIGPGSNGTGDFGNQGSGVDVTQATDNTVGGATVAARNIISANRRHGVAIGLRLTGPEGTPGGGVLPGSGGTGLTVRNNYIGTDLTGDACLGNTLNGVFVDADAVANFIRDNRIACNGNNGICIPDNNNPGVRINLSDNAIYANALLGIDLGPAGITPNDAGDLDGGANLLQNFPVLRTATLISGPESPAVTISVNGSMTGQPPNTIYNINWFYSNATQCGNNQNGPPLVAGRVAGVPSDANGNVVFSFPFTFPPGQTGGVINCTATNDDNTSEFSTCLAVTAAPPAFNSNDVSLSEGNSGLRDAVFTVTRTGDLSQTLTVNYATADDTARAGSDYQAAAGTLTFNPNVTTRAVTVRVIGDTVFEGAETFLLNLTNAQQTPFAVGQGVILNDDPEPPPTLQFSAATFTANEGAGLATITVTRSGSVFNASAVDYQTTGSLGFADCNEQTGTATQRCDYISTSGTLNFAAGEAGKTFVVPLLDDLFGEGNERVALVLSAPVGGTLGTPNSATLSISDNDVTYPAPRFLAAQLNGAQVAPAGVVSTAIGYGTAILSQDETSARLSLSFTGLGSAQTAAHLHGPAHPGVNGPVILTLPNGNVSDVTVSLTPTQTQQLKLGLFYLDVHTSGAAGGEARGQILPNPLESARFFVRQQYLDFLNRVPDTAGFDFWTGQIVNTCGTDLACLHTRRIDVSAAFFVEQEFQESGAYVFRLYKAAFGEAANYRPLYSAFVPDRGRVVGSPNLAQGKLDFANLFANRSEFTTRYPLSQTPTQFVDAVLLTVQQGAGVSFTASERTAFINTVTAMGRGVFLRDLGDNTAFKSALFNRAFVLVQYFGYLKRDPDQAGYDFWLGRINGQPQNIRGMVCAFATSVEYQERVSAVSARGNNDCLSQPAPTPTPTPTPNCVTPPTGLISWWTGDGTARDFLNRNNGALQNGATFTPGKVGPALNFYSDDAIFTAPTTSLPTANTNRTLELWVNVNAFAASEAFLAGYGGFGSNGQSFGLGTLGTTLFFSQWGGSVLGPGLLSNQWRHIAVVSQGDTATLYLDGVAVNSGTVSINTASGTQFYLGRIAGELGNTRRLRGLVDEVSIYNRALTAAEILSIYQAGGNGKCRVAPPG